MVPITSVIAKVESNHLTETNSVEKLTSCYIHQ